VIHSKAAARRGASHLRLVNLIRLSLTLVLVGTGLLTVCGPLPSGASAHLHLPATKAGCSTTAPISGQAVSVPLAVTRAKGQVIALVSVCIDGKGPFPLVLDSGATSSTVDAQVVHALHLPSAGKSTKASGASCTTTTKPVTVKKWSIGSVALQGQRIESTTIPNFGLHKAPAGLLGSDVLSRFGAVRIDYKDEKLILPGAEDPAISGEHVVAGASPPPTPSDLVAGYPALTTVSMDVVYAQHQVVALVPVQFSSAKKFVFIIDTGASSSAVSTTAASTLRLAKLKTRTEVSGVGCEASAAQVKSGRWSLSGVSLQEQTLTSITLPTTSSEGVSGLLGSNQLSHFGSVVLDYAGGRLLI
jgi:predicted aspartyl protease